MRDERLAARGDVVVVGVRLVPLEHRELRVVLERDALVAEVLADLVDALEAADDQALEVELGGDPQVQVAVELVVVGDERARRRAAVERLQDRRLDLDEAGVVEEAAHRGDHLGPRDEHGAALLAREQVDLALPVARLDVGQPVVLVGRRAHRLGEQREAVELERELAAAGAEDGAVGADQVAEVEVEELRHRRLAQHVHARVQLHPPGAVDEVEERGLALPAARGQAPGDARAHVGLLAVGQVGVRRLDGGDRLHAREGVRERVDPGGAELVELAPPVGQDLGELLPLAHGREPTRR